MSTLEERIAERTRIRDKALEKANQCSEQIKRLEKQKNEQERKKRTHLFRNRCASVMIRIHNS